MSEETLNGFDEERIDTIGPNGNEGLHYPKEELYIRTEDIKTYDQLKELFILIITSLSRSKEVIDEIVLDNGYIENLPELKKIARKVDGKDITS